MHYGEKQMSNSIYYFLSIKVIIPLRRKGLLEEKKEEKEFRSKRKNNHKQKTMAKPSFLLKRPKSIINLNPVTYRGHQCETSGGIIFHVYSQLNM